MSAHRSCKVPYSVCLEPGDIKAIELIAKERDLPARIFLRQLVLRSLREEQDTWAGRRTASEAIVHRESDKSVGGTPDGLA